MNGIGISTVEPEDCLSESPEIDCHSVEVKSFAEEFCSGENDLEKSVSLYYAVRDQIRYDPYGIVMTVEGLKASTALITGRGWCVSKAILLAALLRYKGIPAALGYADVKNHLSTQKLREAMGTDVFLWHGYTSIWLNEKWVKATPAFNKELCEKFRIMPLEFNGREDSIYHPHNMDGREHMEYINHRGEYRSVPLEKMKSDFKKFYPALDSLAGGNDFEKEAEKENT